SPVRRFGLAAILLAAATALLVWEPWRPLDRAVGHHPAAQLANRPSSFDSSVRHKGSVVALTAGEKADRRRALIDLTIAAPLARVALIDDGDEIGWSAGWPPTGSTFHLDVE